MPQVTAGYIASRCVVCAKLQWAMPLIFFLCNAMTRDVDCTELYCVALAVLFSGFHTGRHMICCTDRIVMLTSSLPFRDQCLHRQCHIVNQLQVCLILESNQLQVILL